MSKIIELLDSTTRCNYELKEKINLSTYSYILGDTQIECMSNDEVVDFLQWITQGEIEIERNAAEKSTASSSYSVNVRRGPFWIHLGGITVPPKRKPRQGSGNWMEKAMVAMLEKGIKEREDKRKENGCLFAEYNSLLRYCLVNNLLPQDKHNEITKLIDLYQPDFLVYGVDK